MVADFSGNRHCEPALSVKQSHFMKLGIAVRLRTVLLLKKVLQDDMLLGGSLQLHKHVIKKKSCDGLPIALASHNIPSE